jgi:succinate-acetate transporter protein
MIVPAMRVNAAVLLVFVLLALTFILLTIGSFDTSSPIVTEVGGWFGLATAIAAWYASFAGVTNATWKRVVLPVRPLG